MCPSQFQSICLNWIIVVIIKESFQCLEVGFHHSCPILISVSVNIYMYHGVTWDEIILSILILPSSSLEDPVSMHCAWKSWRYHVEQDTSTWHITENTCGLGNHLVNWIKGNYTNGLSTQKKSSWA